MRQVDNGDLLKGVVHTTADGSRSLEVLEIKRIGHAWFAVEGEQWMPESGGSGNGGLWLHELSAPCCTDGCPGKPHLGLIVL